MKGYKEVIIIRYIDMPFSKTDAFVLAALLDFRKRSISQDMNPAQNNKPRKINGDMFLNKKDFQKSPSKKQS
jgi:hypothetical protein